MDIRLTYTVTLTEPPIIHDGTWKNHLNDQIHHDKLKTIEMVYTPGLKYKERGKDWLCVSITEKDTKILTECLLYKLMTQIYDNIHMKESFHHP